MPDGRGFGDVDMREEARGDDRADAHDAAHPHAGRLAGAVDIERGFDLVLQRLFLREQPRDGVVWLGGFVVGGL